MGPQTMNEINIQTLAFHMLIIASTTDTNDPNNQGNGKNIITDIICFYCKKRDIFIERVLKKY